MTEGKTEQKRKRVRKDKDMCRDDFHIKDLLKGQMGPGDPRPAGVMVEVTRCC